MHRGTHPYRLALGVFGALLLAVASSASWAQEEKTRVESGAISGQILAVDTQGGMLTVKEVTGATWVFVTNKDTSYMNGEKEIKLTDLKQGWHVVVNYNRGEGDNGNVALLVEVEDAS
jgi:hypothetical protein